LVAFFLRRFEYEAVNNWNPFGTWTPSESNPRCGYHHVLLGSQYSIGFDIISIAYPLRFRESFPRASVEAHELLSQEFNFGVNYDPRPVGPGPAQAGQAHAANAAPQIRQDPGNQRPGGNNPLPIDLEANQPEPDEIESLD